MNFRASEPIRVFVARDKELAACVQTLAPSDDNTSRLLVLRGDSGTGKTALALRVLAELTQHSPRQLVLYIDLQEDEFTTGNFFEALVCLAWNENELGVPPEPHVPSHAAFRRYAKSQRLRRTTIAGLYESFRNISSVVPGLKGLTAVLPEAKIFTTSGLLGSRSASVVTDYIRWAAKRTPTILAIDNYQFLSRDTRLLLESRINEVSQHIRLFLIDRTVAAVSTLGPILCFSAAQRALALSPFNLAGTRLVVKETLPRLPNAAVEAISRDCQLKTGGNAKLIDIYLRSHLAHADAPAIASDTAVELIGRLPKLARSIVLLTSIFTAGLRQKYVESILRSLVGPESRSIEDAIREMAAIGYIVINGGTGDTLRAHERVITAMRDAIDDEEFLELRALAVHTFDDVLLKGSWNDEEYYYLIHCLIGILHLREAVARVDRIVELVQHQYKTCKYAYVAHVQRSFPEMIGYLPSTTVREVLDSLQRSCEIALGLTAVHTLRIAGFQDATLLALYEAKYLIQQYHYREALTRLAALPESDEVLLQQLIALQSLCRDDEARALIDSRIDGCESTEVRFIILRNATHLFPLEAAVRHLRMAVLHFEMIRDGFATGTSLNNLGVVLVWAGDLDSAEVHLLRAHDALMEVGSHEHLQPKVNLGVLEALRGRLDRAQARFRDARPFVPPQMLWDAVLIDANIVVADLLTGSALPRDALLRLRALYGDALRISDPRLYNLIAWNIEAIERTLRNPATVAVEREFRDMMESRERTGYEVRLSWEHDGTHVKLLLGLSPQWRH